MRFMTPEDRRYNPVDKAHVLLCASQLQDVIQRLLGPRIILKPTAFVAMSDTLELIIEVNQQNKPAR